jgi:hypothetical protein
MEMKMTDSTHNPSLLSTRPTTRGNQTVGVGAFVVAMLIVAALVLAAIKIVNVPEEMRSSLIPMDEPAVHAGFTA